MNLLPPTTPAGPSLYALLVCIGTIPQLLTASCVELVRLVVGSRSSGNGLEPLRRPDSCLLGAAGPGPVALASSAPDMAMGGAGTDGAEASAGLAGCTGAACTSALSASAGRVSVPVASDVLSKGSCGAAARGAAGGGAGAF